MQTCCQLAASIKLTEVWKACNIEEYPIKLENNHDNLLPNDRIVRPHVTRHWKEDGKTAAARDSFTRSAAKLWNQAPLDLRNANNLNMAKKLIRKYCETLPI